jgi:ABC-type transport system substrate-binding protein
MMEKHKMKATTANHFNRRQVIGSGLGAGALAVIAPVIAGAASTNANHTASVTGQDGSQVVIGAWTEPPTLLSGAPVNGASYQQIQRIIANGLVRLGYPAFEVEPDLAESWDISEDNLVHTFHLRDDVTWHDGAPFTANDVKFTYDVVTDPEWPGAWTPTSPRSPAPPSTRRGRPRT